MKPGTGSHVLISHNGPRSDKGGRESYPVADVNVYMRGVERYSAGDEYTMPALEYHHTPCSGIVITVIRKIQESAIHANSVCRRGVDFHYGFDRFQLSSAELFGIVKDAFVGTAL